jgi:hypothetical protein
MVVMVVVIEDDGCSRRSGVGAVTRCNRLGHCVSG